LFSPGVVAWHTAQCDDILFQNTDGSVAIWLMSHTTPAAEALVEANPRPSWYIIP
jgi:hypothetical protein